MTHMSERWGSVLTVLVTRVSIVDLSSGRQPRPAAWGAAPSVAVAATGEVKFTAPPGVKSRVGRSGL